VGNFWSGKPYISDTLTMIWASFGDEYCDEERVAPITFWGYTDDHVALGLTGSSYHVLGHKRPDGHAHSHSVTPAIESWLIKHVKDNKMLPVISRNFGYRHMSHRVEKHGIVVLPKWLPYSRSQIPWIPRN
jgi:hypothetical protein